MFEQLKAIALAFPPGFWTIFGFGLILFELIFSHRRIYLFAGLSALTISFATSYEVVRIPNFFMQFIVFAIMTGIWAVILWLPLKIKDKLRRRNRHLIKTTGQIIGKDLVRRKSTRVRIGKKNYDARLQQDSVFNTIKHGEGIRVIATKGGTLFVEPTSVPLPTDQELQGYRDQIAENPVHKDYPPRR